MMSARRRMRKALGTMGSDDEQAYVQYEEESEHIAQPSHAEDEVECDMAAEDEGYMEALVTLRDPRERMDNMMSARGWFKFTTGGMVDEGAPADKPGTHGRRQAQGRWQR